MRKEDFKDKAIGFIKKWWCSLLLLPFIYYTLHQIYWALRFNIHFAVNYNYPFPLNIFYFLIDNFLLIVHEAGHTFFSLFGVRFITILGGSLFQIILPLLILLYTWVNRKKIGMQLSLFLVGISWLDVAGYAADAGRRQLPLIGGLSKEAHDWYNMLYQLDMLEYDLTIGIIFVGIAIICYLLAIFIPVLVRDYKQVKLNLNI
ncbi:MAG: hypothetical protein R3211_08245 [Balneolaceae bacterium]|nr:hypothetical protein [Balneolaceae bacterium]